jgi:hypothetical protein
MVLREQGTENRECPNCLGGCYIKLFGGFALNYPTVSGWVCGVKRLTLCCTNSGKKFIC